MVPQARSVAAQGGVGAPVQILPYCAVGTMGKGLNLASQNEPTLVGSGALHGRAASSAPSWQEETSPRTFVCL